MGQSRVHETHTTISVVLLASLLICAFAAQQAQGQYPIAPRTPQKWNEDDGFEVHMQYGTYVYPVPIVTVAHTHHPFPSFWLCHLR